MNDRLHSPPLKRLPLILFLGLACTGRHLDEQLDVFAPIQNPAPPVVPADTDPVRQAILMDQRAAHLSGRILDAASQRPEPCRILVEDGGGTQPGAVLSGIGFWADGTFSLAALPGPARVRASRGRRRIEAVKDIYLRPGRRRAST